MVKKPVFGTSQLSGQRVVYNFRPNKWPLSFLGDLTVRYLWDFIYFISHAIPISWIKKSSFWAVATLVKFVIKFEGATGPEHNLSLCSLHNHNWQGQLLSGSHKLKIFVRFATQINNHYTHNFDHKLNKCRRFCDSFVSYKFLSPVWSQFITLHVQVQLGRTVCLSRLDIIVNPRPQYNER